jgi:hypothetical protein
MDLRQPSWSDPELEAPLAGSLTLGEVRLAHVLRQVGAEWANAVRLLSSN